MNDAGQVVAQANTADDHSHAYVWNSVTGQIMDLGAGDGDADPGSNSQAFDNPQGEQAGFLLVPLDDGPGPGPGPNPIPLPPAAWSGTARMALVVAMRGAAAARRYRRRPA